MTHYVEIAFNLPLSGAFTYQVDDPDTCPVGSRVIAPFGNRSLSGFVVGHRDTPPEGVQKIRGVTRVVSSLPLFDADYLELARWISTMYFSTLGEALAAMIPGGRRESEMPALGSDEAEFSSEPEELSQEQLYAVEQITTANRRLFYLYGITGSGKTEVFFQAARKLLSEGRSIIYLVPEISLTHQVVDSIRARFSEESAILHSGLTPSQRLREWMRIRRGEARFVIGARSAIFAPVSNLGLVILDEEHEGSYKSGAAPRYHARQVAMKRCADHGGRLVMGSATPSVEAWHLMEEGVLDRITLTRRLSGGAMPVMQVVDVNRQNEALSPQLVEAIRETHREGRQSILFLNRRGFAYFFHCRSCGYSMKCERCSVNMTYHKQKNAMICHYCGYRARPVDVCPECGSLDVGYSGFGTEHIHEEITRRFPDLVTERVDTDTVRKKGELERIIRQFRSGDIDILLGTQMVAKGLNFPGVKLVGIVHADTGLLLPDFRAAERTFALIMQVSGRAGRFSPDGRVIIQTFRPNNDAIRLAAQLDLPAFYMRELEMRRALGFPPFSRLLRIVFRGKDKTETSAAAAAFVGRAEKALSGQGEILGPAECPLAVIARNYRFQVIVKARSFDDVHHALKRLLSRFDAPRQVYLEIDVDPVSLL